MTGARIAALVGVTAVAVACEGPTGLEPVAEVTVRQEHVVVDLGDTVQVEARAYDARGRELPVTRIHWASNDPRVVTVDPEGRATAVGVGTTTVTAEAGGRVRHVVVEVTLAFEELAAGLVHTCGLTLSRRAVCWGGNEWGELGDASLTASGQPVLVREGRAFRSLTAGGTHSCGATDDGTVLCWGANWSGQLGTGTAEKPAGGRK